MFRALGLISAVAIAASSAPALAAPFLKEAANWTVLSLGNSCIGVNRPPTEYNYSPWNSLTLTAPKAGGILIAPMFWPGVLQDGKAYTLTLQADGGAAHEVAAEAGTMGLRSSDPLPEAIVTELAGTTMVMVGASGVDAELAFDTTHVGEVLGLLEACRKGLAE